jgi:hypothetical protein
VPQLVIDISKDLTPSVAADVMAADAVDSDPIDDDAEESDRMDADALNCSPMDVDAEPNCGLSYVAADAAFLSEGSTAIFPRTIRPRVGAPRWCPTHDAHPRRVEDHCGYV